jgi:hypothetical protein
MKVTCTRTGKQTYGTHERAVRDAINGARLFGRPFRVYRCEFCGFLHLTTRPWRPPPRRAAP